MVTIELFNTCLIFISKIAGYDGTAAVCILEAGDKNVQGVVRFVQPSPDICIIDGTIDGLKPGNHNIAIHECGDISKGVLLFLLLKSFTSTFIHYS